MNKPTLPLDADHAGMLVVRIAKAVDELHHLQAQIACNEVVQEDLDTLNQVLNLLL